MGLIPGSAISPEVGNSNRLPYSCLENSMDRGAWWTPGVWVAKSRTWLSDWVHIKSETKKESWKQQEKSDWSHTKGASIRLVVDFTAETLQSRKEWNNILKLLKEKKNSENQLRKPYLAKLSLKIKKLRLFEINKSWESSYNYRYIHLHNYRSVLQEILKRILPVEHSCGRQQYRAVWKYTILW